MEPRNAYDRGQEDTSHTVQKGKPTISSNRKAAVPAALWWVAGIPPGS